MVDSSGGADLWLSSQAKLLVVEDMFCGDKENVRNGVKGDPGSTLCFPAEFPYEFDFFSESSALASPVESVKDSTETANTDGEEDFLAALTRRLSQSSIRETRKLPGSSFSYACEKPQKNCGLAHSPQSTLTGMESWSASSAVSSDGSPNGPSQVPSPTSTPFPAKNDNWDVIFAAAGQVAKLKMNGEVTPNSNFQTRGPFSTPHTVPQVAKSPNHVMYQAETIGQTSQQLNLIDKQVRQEQILKQQCSSIWARQAEVSLLQRQELFQNRGQNNGCYNRHCVRSNCLPQTAWPPLRLPHATQSSRYCRPVTRGVPLAGSGAKRECAGTGVFLPRSYDGNNIEPRNKKSCSTVLLPSKAAYPRNFDIEGTQETRLPSGFPTEHDVMVMASRNAVFIQQRRHLRQNGVIHQDIRLPQDWTY